MRCRIAIERIFMPILVFAIAAFIYSQYGFRGQLLKDDALYLYSGQRMAQDVPPYIAVLQIKGPLAPMLAGVGAMVSKRLAWDDIFTVRLVFFLVSCLTVVAVYLLGDSLYRSQRVGVFCSLNLPRVLWLRQARRFRA